MKVEDIGIILLALVFTLLIYGIYITFCEVAQYRGFSLLQAKLMFLFALIFAFILSYLVEYGNWKD